MKTSIDEFSDATLLPILGSLTPLERKKMLLLQRELCSPVAYGWIDRQLILLNDVAVDPDWIATIRSDPRFPRLRGEMARYWAQR
jgi:hypothetical protein